MKHTTSPPLTYSMTKYILVLVAITSYSCTMLGCRTRRRMEISRLMWEIKPVLRIFSLSMTLMATCSLDLRLRAR
ncbi:hypothetical protein HanXRQr2_Chr11g0502741 [Helianthus annuus]|uniref:Uncharacterized protein n=2 Tax=Helianthus annuus TaxID=4232 RepID=A0A9K3HRI4_HELAN|nr:hypothetical protein HanXRQr2_Chr11g0502741 [Helianthus annuus]